MDAARIFWRKNFLYLNRLSLPRLPLRHKMASSQTAYIYVDSVPAETADDAVFVHIGMQNLDEAFGSSIAPVAPTYTPRIDESVLLPLPFVPREVKPRGGVFIFYVLVAVIWSVLYRRNLKTLLAIWKSVFSNSALIQMLDGRGGLNSILSVITFLMGVSVISLFVFQVLQVYPIIGYGVGVNLPNGMIFIVFVAVVLLLLMKTIFVLLSSFIFKAQQAFTMYLSLNIISIQLVGLVLFPVVVLFSYGEVLNSIWVVGSGILLVAILFVFRLFRTFFLGVKQTNSQVFHIILYICALEILPILVAGRLLLNN